MCILALMNMSCVLSYVPVATGKEGKLGFASQSQELFKCQGVNFTDRITMQLHPRLSEQSFDLFRSIIVDWLYLLPVLHTIVNGYFPVYRNPSYSVFLAHPLTPEDIAKNNKENTLSCPRFMCPAWKPDLNTSKTSLSRGMCVWYWNWRKFPCQLSMACCCPIWLRWYLSGCQPSVAVVTEQLVVAADGEEKSLTRENGRSMIGWNAVHPCFILTKILGTVGKRRTKTNSLTHRWLATFIPHLGLQSVKTFWIMVQWSQLLGPVERLAGHCGEVGD